MKPRMKTKTATKREDDPGLLRRRAMAAQQALQLAAAGRFAAAGSRATAEKRPALATRAERSGST
jgi:hypothetical protein